METPKKDSVVLEDAEGVEQEMVLPIKMTRAADRIYYIKIKKKYPDGGEESIYMNKQLPREKK